MGSCTNAKYILDVGAGSGLISLQLAQRNPWASITSIEIDPAAAAQAKENIQSSPWSDRMEVICSDFRDYHAENKFDLIVSNPPYIPAAAIAGLAADVQKEPRWSAGWGG